MDPVEGPIRASHYTAYSLISAERSSAREVVGFGSYVTETLPLSPLIFGMAGPPISPLLGGREYQVAVSSARPHVSRHEDPPGQA